MGTEMGRLTNLFKLSLNDCDFSGPLPTQLGYLWNMTRLQMKNNAFTGTIPREYGRFDELEQFTLEGNKLTGKVPLEVCDLLKENLNQFVVDCYNKRNGKVLTANLNAAHS